MALFSWSFRGWILALAGAILLNISLFGLMPGLIQHVPNRPDALDIPHQIQVIRIKKLSPPEPPKEPEPLKKPEIMEKSKPVKNLEIELKPSVKPRPHPLKLRVPFELNPTLPAAPLDLVLPAPVPIAPNPPKIKSHYTTAELDTPLTARVKISPIYPFRASRKSIEGFVTVEFFVTPKGSVKNIRIIDATPRDMFEKSVTQCVSQWSFNPGTVNGNPVEALVRTTIRFELEK